MGNVLKNGKFPIGGHVDYDDNLGLFYLCSLNNRNVATSPGDVHCTSHLHVRLLPFLYLFHILLVYRTMV